jgi:phosphohistidine phosphatase SixA
MRHATAPGVGDSSNFDVNDCSTQRNLSNEGRQQASKIGEKIRKHGIKTASVFSSAWCRCRETAELLNIGKVSTLQPLNSFFRNSAQRQPQTNTLKDWLAKYKFNSPLFLVTHNVNIRALTGAYTNQGDIVVVRIEPTGGLVVLGKL